MDFSILENYDKDVHSILQKEIKRQQNTIELIASENFTSENIMLTTGSFFTNKYAEGTIGKRFYGGCEHCDEIEELAVERAKKLFGAEYVNVQPYSGAIANLAIYLSVLRPGDSILGMDLSHGGHLTHGSKVNISGIYFNSFFYTVDKDTGLIDYDNVLKIAKEVKPKIIIAGASAYPRQIDFKKFREICDEIGAYLLADISHIAGLIIAGLHPSPIEYADFVTTTTHKTLRGPRGAMIMSKQIYAKQIAKALFPGIQGGPLMNVIAGKALAFGEALKDDFKEYQKQIIINAKTMADVFMKNNVKCVSNGTDNHLVLLDLTCEDNLTGKDLQDLLSECGIIVNKNSIPYDPRSFVTTSGIRIGTPGITTRGLKQDDCAKIAYAIVDVIKNRRDAIDRTKELVKDITNKYPLYTNTIV